ncbi:MAG TPA: RsmE family RNA methyltransferase [Acidimicrobiia bacterium]|nr:RsmE family RNA methyltransferase [Acidimicrobiia bacterium]
MKHIPHLVLNEPWKAEFLRLSDMQRHHLVKVLRMSPGDVVTYTDGRGILGRGEVLEQVVRRGEEEHLPRPTNLTVVTAPPASKNRLRFLVEKLAELGTRRLMWLNTRYGKNHLVGHDRLLAWVVAATEQSRGAWMMDVGERLVGWDDLEAEVVVCQQGGDKMTPNVETVVIGPEGGFADDEIPLDVPRWELGPNILRIETAAITAVAKLSG